jgi:hypothetical protein
MSSTQLSICLTVEDFFTQSNWHGLELIPKEVPSPVTTISLEEIETPSLTLSVENFFARSNWRGEPQVIIHGVQERENSDHGMGLTPALTITVGEFFRRMVWQPRNKPNIAEVPEVKSPQKLNPQPQSINVSDLFDLF